MSVLIDSEIRSLSNSSEPFLLFPFDEKSLQGASYDLRLGDKIVQKGIIHTLTDNSPSLVISPGEFAILSTYEKLNIPLDIIGHNGIMSRWAKRGIVSLFSPQIDPGFRGMLIVPVFNAGDSDVIIQFKREIFTVEFSRTSKAVEKGWSDIHGDQDKIDDMISPTLNRPNLLDIRAVQKEVNDITVIAHRLQEQATNADVQIQKLHQDISISNGKLDALKERLDTSLQLKAFGISKLGVWIGFIGLITSISIGSISIYLIFNPPNSGPTKK
jgi:dCTP deaminase